MNEILLNSILNLFAIQAAMRPETDSVESRLFPEQYLRRHILLSQPEVYLGFYDAALSSFVWSDQSAMGVHASRTWTLACVCLIW